MVILRSGEWIRSLKCFTADTTKNTGGKIIEYKNCRIARRQTMEQSGMPVVGFSEISRPANHNENFTLNLEMKNIEIRKVHPALIFEINEQPVL